MSTLIPVLFAVGWILTALGALYGLASFFSEKVRPRWWFWILVAALCYAPVYLYGSEIAPVFRYAHGILAALACAGGLALSTDGRRASLGVPMILVGLATCGLQFLISSPSKDFTMHTIAAKKLLQENLRSNLDSALPTFRTISLIQLKAPHDGSVADIAARVQGPPSKILQRLSSFTVPILHEEWYTPITQLRRVEYLPMTLKYSYRPGENGLLIAEPVRGGEPRDSRGVPMKERGMSFGAG